MTQEEEWMEGWLAGDLPDSEMEAFQTWLRADPRNRRVFLSAVALDQDLRASYRLPHIHRLRNWRSILTIASAAAVLIICVSLVSQLLKPASNRVVYGWTLSANVLIEHRPAPVPTAPAIVAPKGGQLERAGALLQLQPGARVLLQESESGDRTVIHLESGRLTAILPEVGSSTPSAPAGLGVETACGKVLIEPGSKVEFTAQSMDFPFAADGTEVQVLVQKGSVIPPSLGPQPGAPQPWKAGSRMRLTRIETGPVQVEEITGP